MKKSFFLLPLCALALAACTSNEPLVDEGNGSGSNPDGNQFLSISIASTGKGTRAAEYVDGSGKENNVNSVRFYFFRASGAPAQVKFVAPPSEGGEGSYLSYYDWTPGEGEYDEGPTESLTPDNPNVEKILQTTIIINTEDKDAVPYSVVAVLNPEGLNLGTSNLSISDLNAILGQYNTAALTTAGDGAFPMTNSVYIDEKGIEMEATPVAGHISTTVAGAKANPVDIYVEREVARMDLTVGLTPVPGMTGVYDTQVKYDVDNVAGDALDYSGNIYVKFLGWNITATPTKTRLMKNINPEWPAGLFGVANEPWNAPALYRSFWANNAASTDINFQYGNFGVALPPTSNPNGYEFTASEVNRANLNPFGVETTPVYMQENAGVLGDPDGFCEPYDYSKLIIAAQLVQSDGTTPLTVCEWGFNLYTLEGLKTLFANQAGVYKVTTVPGAEGTQKTVYTKISASDIEFVTASQIDPTLNNVEKTGRYYVYPQLKNENNVVWALSNAEGTPSSDYADANLVVQRQGPAKIWNNGYTYYYFGINHLGAADFPGYFGIVRNHVYQTTINTIKGLGTPVYNPNETIYPEKPVNDDSMIAARINILTWRVVKKTVDLAW